MTSESQEKDALKSQVRKVTRPEFVEGVVYPVVSEGSVGGAPSRDYKVTFVQDRGAGRITLKYLFGDGTQVFGKLYSDGLVRHSFQLLKALWEGGFGKGQPYQVSQPLLYVPEYALLLTRPAEGTPLTPLIGHDDPELERYVRQAAQWLVRLHCSHFRIGRAEPLWHSLKLFKVVRRLAKASAIAPQERKRMVEMVDALCQKGRQGLATVPAVQTHGRFHHEHVLVNGSMTTVIDFDRSLPSDPSKDLAEFLSMLRLRTFQLTGGTAEADSPTRAFIDEYLSHLPENAANLAIYWGAFLLLTFLRNIRRYKPGDQFFERKMEFFRGEFDAVLSGKPVPGYGIPGGNL